MSSADALTRQDSALEAAVRWLGMLEAEAIKLRGLKRPELYEICKNLTLPITARMVKTELINCKMVHCASTAVPLTVVGRPAENTTPDRIVVDVTDTLYTRTLASTAPVPADKDKDMRTIQVCWLWADAYAMCA